MAGLQGRHDGILARQKLHLPLSQHVLFASHDLDEARERVARIFCPHRLDIIGKGALNARHHHVRGEAVSLNYIEYGAKTLIAPDELDGFYLLQIPVSGSAYIVNGSDRYYSGPEQAAVLNPHVPTTMIWEQGTRQILVQFSRTALQNHLSRLLQMQALLPLCFTGALDLSEGAGATLRRLVLFLVAEVARGEVPLGNGSLLGRQMEEALMTGLINAHENNYTAHLGRPAHAPASKAVRQAENFICGNLKSPITISEIAQAAGVSARGLQLAFKHHRGTTPLAFWRKERLLRAHADLVAASPDLSVTDIALRWGFNHLGRFSQIYKDQFGVHPRDTHHAARENSFQD